MKEEDIKNIWTASGTHYFPADVKSIRHLQGEIDRMDKVIKKRDWLEISLAVLVVIAFEGMLFLFDNIYTKLGCILILLSSVMIVGVLRKYRKRNDQVHLLISEHIRAELRFYRNQRRLLKNVSFWYILPIFAGLTLFYLGVVGSWTEFVGFTFINLGVMIFVMYLNRQAIRKEIDPFIASLEKVQLNLENE